MINKFSVSLFLILFLFVNSFAAANSDIRFLDLEYVFNNSTAGKKINDQIEKEAKIIKDDLAKYKKTVDEEKKSLINQKNILAEDEFKQKTLILEKKVNDYNKTISQKNNKLLKFRNNMKNQFSKELQNILKNYAKNNSINMIVNKKDVLVGNNNLDITKDILDLFNKNIKTIKVK